MLDEETTTGVIVYGVQLDLTEFTKKSTARAYNNFNRRTHALSPYQHIVPGETYHNKIYDYSPTTLLGIPVGIFSVYQSPGLITIEAIEQAPVIFEENLQLLHDADDAIINAALDTPPQFYLTGVGPLAFTSLVIGKIIATDDCENATYRFHSTTSMSQRWRSKGVDGITITGSEFFDIVELDLDAERVERWKERVPEFEDPQLYLSVRFD